MALAPIFTAEEQRAVASLQERLVSAPWPALGLQAAIMACVRGPLDKARTERHSGPVLFAVHTRNGDPGYVQAIGFSREPRFEVK